MISLDSLIFRIENFITVMSTDIEQVDSSILIQGSLYFLFFYFISKWFKAYVIRLFIFLFGVFLIYNAMGKSSILFDVDIYIGIAFITPHIEIVEITYLIIKEKFYRLYRAIVNTIQFILSPIFWTFNKSRQAYYFFKSKSDDRKYRQEQKAYGERSKKFFDEEQQRQYEYQKQQEQERRYREQQKQRESEEKEQQSRQQYHKQESNNSYSRWDDSDPYVVLGIDRSATAEGIKKAYRNLSKIYHPDMTLTKKEEYQIIFQKINSAYSNIKNKT